MVTVRVDESGSQDKTSRVDDLLPLGDRDARRKEEASARHVLLIVREEFVAQRTDSDDRRRRMLYLMPKGEELERLLTERQSRRIARAYREAGAEAVEGFRTVLRGIINEEDRRRVTLAGSGRR